MNENFKVVIKHLAVTKKEKVKKVSETILFEAVNFSDAETKANEMIEEQGLKEAIVHSIVKTFFSEIIEDPDGSHFFEAVVKESFENDKGKVQVINVKSLIKGSSISQVSQVVNKLYESSTISYTIQSVKKSSILNYFKSVGEEE